MKTSNKKKNQIKTKFYKKKQKNYHKYESTNGLKFGNKTNIKYENQIKSKIVLYS